MQIGHKNKGTWGELFAMSEAVVKGYVVSFRVETDLLGYDFIMDSGKKLYRVEVKTTDYTRTSKSDGKKFLDRVTFNLDRGNTNNSKYDYIHYFALVCKNLNKIAWVKTEDISGAMSKKTIFSKDFDLYYSLPKNKILLNKKDGGGVKCQKQIYLF